MRILFKKQYQAASRITISGAMRMSPKKKSKRKNNESKQLDEFLETGHKQTQQELESHLWESANILRGSIDATDYKN
jgi:uncharacterized membrane-anchored protein YhcB (DUF1043 family)